MAKAEIFTNTGAKILIDGSVEEISAIISIYNDKNNKLTDPIKNKSNRIKTNKGLGSSSTLVSYILELRDTGFFDTPKKTALVKERLDQDSHFYPMQSISTCLINRNAKKELKRVKDGKQWAYVKR